MGRNRERTSLERKTAEKEEKIGTGNDMNPIVAEFCLCDIT